MGALRQCQKCGRSMDEETQFYLRKDRTRMDLCKKCLTMHIDNFNPDTFLWILEDMDFPWIPEEWNILRDKAFAKNPNLNGMSVLGKYLAKMRIKQWMDYSWKDSAMLQEKNENQRAFKQQEQENYEKELKEKLENGEISEAQYKTMVSTPTQNQELLYAQPTAPSVDNPYGNFNDFIPEDQMVDLGADLTEDDKLYLAMKWGRLYKPAEWVALEKTYEDMMKSFDIQDADTINTLILICKTNLKMNQALDSGDVEGYQKLSKVSNDLRKSAKFTAAQNKDTKGEFVNSVGELVAYCEKNGGAIPKYEINTPQDIIDKVIDDLKGYTKELIYEDKSLAKQIEDYLKKLEIAKQMKNDMAEARAAGFDTVQLKDEDFADYADHINEQKSLDEELLIQKSGDE